MVVLLFMFFFFSSLLFFFFTFISFILLFPCFQKHAFLIHFDSVFGDFRFQFLILLILRFFPFFILIGCIRCFCGLFVALYTAFSVILATLGEGLYDFLYFPYLGIMTSPNAFLLGTIKGSSSLVRRTIASLCTTISHFSESMQVGLIALGVIDPTFSSMHLYQLMDDYTDYGENSRSKIITKNIRSEEIIAKRTERKDNKNSKETFLEKQNKKALENMKSGKSENIEKLIESEKKNENETENIIIEKDSRMIENILYEDNRKIFFTAASRSASMPSVGRPRDGIDGLKEGD